MISIAVVTANCGAFDKIILDAPQVLPEFFKMDRIIFDDSNFPPRVNSMTPRLQARIPKCFAWQMAPGYDYYIWIDASLAMTSANFVSWLLEQLTFTDAAFLVHPERKTINEEYLFIKEKIKSGNLYLKSRYENEFDDEQMEFINSDKSYKDDKLFASSLFIYRNNKTTQDMLKDWWVHISRFHTVDQLALPYVLQKSGCTFKSITEPLYKSKYFAYVRNKK